MHYSIIQALCIKYARKDYKRGILYIYLTKQELINIKKIQHSNFKVNIGLYKLKYKKPHNSIQECISSYKNYSISIYVPIRIKYKKIEIFQYE